MIKPILKMGEPSLFETSKKVQRFDTPELHALLADLRDTMQAANGAGIAAPQIGVNLQVVIFGSEDINPRYPDVPKASTRSYGVVSGTQLDERTEKVSAIVEKPAPEAAPLRKTEHGEVALAVVGRYILTPKIFELLQHVKPGAGGEIQLTDGISALLQHETVFAHRFAGTR